MVRLNMRVSPCVYGANSPAPQITDAFGGGGFCVRVALKFVPHLVLAPRSAITVPRSNHRAESDRPALTHSSPHDLHRERPGSGPLVRKWGSAPMESDYRGLREPGAQERQAPPLLGEVRSEPWLSHLLAERRGDRQARGAGSGQEAPDDTHRGRKHETVREVGGRHAGREGDLAEVR